MSKIIAFDCDSTLSAIEGVDELGRLAGPEVFAKVEDLTNQAMNGEIAIEEIFGRRLDLIQPTREQCEGIGDLYIEHIEPTAKRTISELQEAGWEVIILSGGFKACIEPLARELNIERIEAVPLFFNDDGSYAGFDSDYPTTRNGGKPEILSDIKSKANPERLVMVGDGVSDLETQTIVDSFVAFTKYISREKVVKDSQHQADTLCAIKSIIF